MDKTQYYVKMPRIIEKLIGNYVFCKVPNAKAKTIYLTFDDGPTQYITNWIINTLEHYNVKATFFCLGKNIQQYPLIYNKIIQNGHAVGNHTYNHLNGFKTNLSEYEQNVKTANLIIHSKLFRPPYGRIRPLQAYRLKKNYIIVMWSLLSLDYEKNLNISQTLNILYKNLMTGSIIVFHDSIKSEKNMKIMLPKLIEYALENNFKFEILSEDLFNKRGF